MCIYTFRVVNDISYYHNGYHEYGYHGNHSPKEPLISADCVENVHGDSSGKYS